jgi:prophage regulatory protein
MQSKRILRIKPDVMSRTGLSRSTIYNLINSPESNFPKPIKLSVRSVGILESELEAWLDNLQNSRLEG